MMENIENIENDTFLFFNAGVLVDDAMYFTACNSEWLYMLCMENGQIFPVTRLPYQMPGAYKFSALIHYAGKIWMIPRDERDIMIYDIEKKWIALLSLPFPIQESDGAIEFRKVVQQENEIWLIPSFEKIILKIDMEEISCEIYERWSQAVDFKEELSMNFKCMYGEKENLYLFADGCERNLIFNTQTHEIRPWGKENYHTFGVAYNDKIYLSPVKNFDCIKCFAEPEEGKEEVNEICQIKLPDEIFGELDIYAYWYGEIINEKVYFLPHSANALIILDILSDKVQIVPLDVENYGTLRENKRFAAHDAMPYGEAALITPYAGNMILLEREGKIVQKYLLQRTDIKMEAPKDEEAQQFINSFLGKGIISWSKVTTDRTNEVDTNEIEKSETNKSGKIGQLIYETLMGRKI